MYESYLSSGQTVTKWCVENGVSKKTFYYQLREICREAIEQAEQHDVVMATASPSPEAITNSMSRINDSVIANELLADISSEIVTTAIRGLFKCWKNLMSIRHISCTDTRMSLVFEIMCMDFMFTKNSAGKLPVLFTEIGRWRGSDSRTRSQAEIDLVARDGSSMIMVECKWRKELLDMRVLANPASTHVRPTSSNISLKMLFPQISGDAAAIL